MSEKMDPIKKDKIITFTVIGLVMLDMIAMAVLMALHTTGNLDQEAMLNISTVLSVLMAVIIVSFIIYSYKAKPKLIEYKKQRDGIVDEKNPEDTPEEKE